MEKLSGKVKCYAHLQLFCLIQQQQLHIIPKIASVPHHKNFLLQCKTGKRHVPNVSIFQAFFPSRLPNEGMHYSPSSSFVGRAGIPVCQLLLWALACERLLAERNYCLEVIQTRVQATHPHAEVPCNLWYVISLPEDSGYSIVTQSLLTTSLTVPVVKLFCQKTSQQTGPSLYTPCPFAESRPTIFCLCQRELHENFFLALFSRTSSDMQETYYYYKVYNI